MRAAAGGRLAVARAAVWVAVVAAAAAGGRLAVAGAAVWVAVAAAAAAGLTGLTLVQVLLLLAPLVLVPLGLRVAEGAPWPVPPAVTFLSAVLLVPALVGDRGIASALLAGGWVGATVLAAAAATWRWARTPGSTRWQPGAIARPVAFAYLVVAAFWLVASRMGFVVAGVREPIVELTAVHYHYAGFVAAVLAARTWKASAPAHPRAAGAATVLTLAAPPLIALGFLTRSALFQVGGAALLAAGLWLLAGLVLAVVRPAAPTGPARALHTLSATAVLVPMALAVSWAAGQYADVPALDIPAMSRVHGTLNALGFSLCGLLGWVVGDRAGPAQEAIDRQ